MIYEKWKEAIFLCVEKDNPGPWLKVDMKLFPYKCSLGHFIRMSDCDLAILPCWDGEGLEHAFNHTPSTSPLIYVTFMDTSHCGFIQFSTKFLRQFPCGLHWAHLTTCMVDLQSLLSSPPIVGTTTFYLHQASTFFNLLVDDEGQFFSFLPSYCTGNIKQLIRTVKGKWFS